MYVVNVGGNSIAILKNKLEKASHSEHVLIKADRDVTLSKVVNIWDFCRAIGIEQVNIATNQETR